MANTYTKGLTIDGLYFDVPFISIKRDADVLDKYAERTKDGVLRREVIGTYFNYTMGFGTIDDTRTYNKLWDKLTEPVAFHTVTLPSNDGNLTYSAYISSVSDEFEKILENKTVFKGLTCKFTAEKPTRT